MPIHNEQERERNYDRNLDHPSESNMENQQMEEKRSPSSDMKSTPNEMGRPIERSKTNIRPGARGTAAMDPETRQEVARKGGLAVSRNKQHMAEIGRKGGQSVSRNREHMANIGRKGGAASRGHRSS